MVSMIEYNQDILCSGTSRSRTPNPTSCTSALALMPASYSIIAFGASSPDSKTAVPLPQQFSPRKYCLSSARNLEKRLSTSYQIILSLALWDPQDCHITLEISQPGSIISTSWFSLWAAAIAINTTCVAHGLAGSTANLGKFTRPAKTLSLGNVKEFPYGLFRSKPS